MSKTKRNTVSFEPDDDVLHMLKRAITAPNGRIPWGMQTFKINEVLRDGLTKQGFARKRDALQAA